MAKYKAVKKKQDNLPPQMRQGVPCLIIVIAIIALIFIAMFFAMKNAG